ncbi:MAG: cytochrome C [Candidatus Eremiobacteraeota bacterium]|nr:cytochrome C [Candidatus Eremiobacteraeota bacterium]
MLKKTIVIALLSLVYITAIAVQEPSRADQFTSDDVKRWEQEYMSMVKKGRELFVSSELGTNGVACAQCHPNAANTHPETYPKFQKQLGRVITLREMINWCLINPLEGKALAPDDPRMTALEAYITSERKGVPLAPGKH